MTNKISIGVAALAVTALALTACSNNAPQGGDSSSSGTVPLSVGNFLDVTSWDPSLADIGFDVPYLSAVYDPLVVDDGNGAPAPALATDWEVSDDYLTITMNLRTGVTFSNGEEFNAEAAVKSLEYLQDGVRSQEAFTKVAGFEAVDENTIEIHLTQRDDTILYFMGLGRSYMMAPAAIDDGSLVDAPVGSGPYLLAEDSVPGSEYRFEKVVDHWATDEFPFDPLTISPVMDATAILNGLEGGQFQVIYGDRTAIEQSENNGYNVSSGVATWVGLQFTDRTGSTEAGTPFGDVRVRQALNYAFDGPAMLEALAQGEGASTNQVFPSGTPGNVASLNDRYAYNIDKAKELMAAAGYADGFDLKMPMAPPFQVYQASVEQAFGELGISVSFDDYQFQDYQGSAPTYPVFISVIAMDGNPVATVERQITNPQWYNPTPSVDAFPEVKAQTEAVFTAEPGDAQLAEIERLNELVTEEAWLTVWYQANNAYISTADFTVTPVIGMMFPTLRHIDLVR